MSAALFWFRLDLRLLDNPGLKAAAACGKPLYLLYLRDTTADANERPGLASDWWLRNSLSALAKDIALRGSRLILRSGNAEDVIMRLVHKQCIDEVHVNRLYEPLARERDKSIFEALRRCGVAVHSHSGSVLFEPGTILNKAGSPYQVFAPFWKTGCLPRIRQLPMRRLAPRQLLHPGRVGSERLAAWALQLHDSSRARRFFDQWQPGEMGARKALSRFASGGARCYESTRNRLDWEGTSRLSPHLHFGEIAPWTVLQSLCKSLSPTMAEPYLRQLGRREFCCHLLWHFPTLATKNFRAEFDEFSWRENARELAAWQNGQTGYPIVDAGMRQLWRTGWMHDRVRKIVASFLVKDLRMHWSIGERWFWNTLVDANLANNAAGWQYVAGSGADAVPYFRVFNPVLQAARFDPEGQYVRKWVPELERLKAPHIHAPWRAPPLILAAARVRLGRDYPEPIVDHSVSAGQALLAYRKLRSG